MIFFRAPAAAGGGAGAGAGGELSIRSLRVLTLVALVAYPAGALIRLFAPATQLGEVIALVIGSGLILAALAAAAPIAGSRLHRIVSKDTDRLDEMEGMLRNRALGWSYNVLAGLVLAMLVYAGIAADVGLWVPATYEEWNGLFWGAFLYLVLLPTTRLAWTTDASPEQDD